MVHASSTLRRFRRALPAIGLLLPISLQAQTAPPRVPLSTAAVATTLRDAGFVVEESQISLPFHLDTSSPEPLLLVTGAEALEGARLRVRLACSDNHQCLPFFAMVQYAERDAVKNAAASFSHSSSASRLPIRTAAITALRPGDHAMLLLEDKQMQITLPVFSIDSGRIGSTVRVSSLDRKKTFQAIVMNAQTVRGTLP